METIFASLLGAVVGGLFVVWATKRTLADSADQLLRQREQDNKEREDFLLADLEVEIDQNIQICEGQEELRAYTYFIDKAWSAGRYVFKKRYPDCFELALKAYVEISQNNSLIQGSIADTRGKVKSCKIRAKPLLENLKKGLKKS